MRSRLYAGVLLIMVIVQITPVLAQEEEEPLPPPRRSRAAKVGGGGGFTPVFLFWSVDDLNANIPSNAGKFDKSPMLLLGGQGYAYIMLLDNLRVGGMGVGGSTKISALEVSTGVRRDTEVSINFGGVTFEYVIPIFERLDVVPGIMLGGGGMGIKLTRDQGGFKNWNNLWSDFGFNSSTPNVSQKLEGTFFVYQPSLQIEVAILRWLGLRAGVSYVGMFAPKWKLDQQFDVAGVPDKINGRGWIITSGIFLGTFLF